MWGERSRAKDNASFHSFTFAQFHSYFSFVCYNIFIGFVHSTCCTNFLYLILFNVVHLWIHSSYNDEVHIHYFIIGMFICLYDCPLITHMFKLMFVHNSTKIHFSFCLCFCYVLLFLKFMYSSWQPNFKLFKYDVDFLLYTLNVYIGNCLHFCDGHEIK